MATVTIFRTDEVMTFTDPRSPAEESLAVVAAHLVALQIKLRALHAHHPGPVITGVLDDLSGRISAIADLAADSSTYLREAHRLDPLLGVTREADHVAASVITAYVTDADQGDFETLYGVLDDLFSRPDTTFRSLAAVIAALARDAVTLAQADGADVDVVLARLRAHLADALSGQSLS